MNIHPALSAVPATLALLTLTISVLNSIGLQFGSKAETLLWRLLALSCFVTYLSGFIGQSFVNNASEELLRRIDSHESWARLTTITAIFSWSIYEVTLLGRNPPKALTIVAQLGLGTSTTMLLFTSHLGGDLVFRYGAAVKNYFAL